MPVFRLRIDAKLDGALLFRGVRGGEIVRQSFSGRAYKIRKISLNPSGFVPQPRPYMAARAMACADVAPPPLEGGQSMITVSANGTIEVE